MGLIKGFQRQMRSVIEWSNPSDDVLFYQWTDNGDEIKNASKLIVGPGQGCIFVYEGVPKAVFTKSGMVNLGTANIPFWTTIKKFMQFFESEHKVGIFFFKTTKVLNQKWGTRSIIKYEDPKYKFPVGLEAFGNYSFRISEPEHFFINVVGHNNGFTVNDFKEVMNSRIVQPLTDYLAESQYTYTDIDKNRDEIAADLLKKLDTDFHKLGFNLTDFRVEGTSFDESTMERINRVASVSADVEAAKVAGLDYANLQKIEAMRDAARNEGGGAGVGMGVGAGMGFGQMMANSMEAGFADPGNTAPSQKNDPMVKLQKLKQMLDAQLITQDEYDVKKKEILTDF
jgi:membrane protease subunit (stomatin/prohibitin family)